MSECEVPVPKAISIYILKYDVLLESIVLHIFQQNETKKGNTAKSSRTHHLLGCTERNKNAPATSENKNGTRMRLARANAAESM